MKNANRNKGYPFYLKRPHSENPTGIFLKTSFGGVPFKYGIGKKPYSIYPELWDKEKHLPTTDRTLIKKYERLNPNVGIELQNIKTRIENIERRIKTYLSDNESNQETLNLTDLKTHLDEIIKKVEKPSEIQRKPYILPFLEDTIKGMTKGSITISGGKRRGQRYTLGTIKNYQGLLEQWKLFEKWRGKKVKFGDVDTNLHQELITYFNSKKYSINTIGRHIRCLKVILDIAYNNDLHQLVPEKTYRHKNFVAPEGETESVVLTLTELKEIEKLDLKDRPSHDLARDVFLVGCYTALRYSDYNRIRPEHLKKNNTLSIKTKKTGTRVIIPIKPELMKILKKYGYSLPRTYEQKVNQYIKEIVRLAKITELIPVEKVKGGLTVKSMVPKCDLIMTHTARRTGVTIMYNEKVGIENIMKITGHKTEKSFRKYLKISAEDAAAKMAEMEYFKGKNEETKIVQL